MPRDETRDVLIICDENGAPSNEYSGFWYHRTLTAKSLQIAPKDSLERFSPHSQLADLERQLANRELEMQAFIRQASEVPGLSATLDQVTWERDQLSNSIAERDETIWKLRAAIDAAIDKVAAGNKVDAILALEIARAK